MSEIINSNPRPTTEVFSTVNSTSTYNSSNQETTKLSKDYKFWARFNQVLYIIGGVLSLPVGVLSIIGAVKFNKSIELVDQTSNDSKTQEFVNSVKEFQKWSVISFLVALFFGLLLGLIFGAIIFSAVSGMLQEASKGNSDYNFNLDNPKKESSFRNGINTSPLREPSISTDPSKAFNISNDEGSMSMDANGNMKMIDKDGKVTTINMDGTMETEK